MKNAIFQKIILISFSFLIGFSTMAQTVPTEPMAPTEKELTVRKARELFLTQKLKGLENEYTEWQFKKVVLKRYAVKTGTSAVIEFFMSPDLPVRYLIDFGVFSTAFYFTLRELGQDACGCGCFIGPLLGATAAGAVAVGGSELVMTLFRGWYRKAYTNYYTQLTGLSQEGLEEEWFRIQGALEDLGRQILQTRQDLRSHMMAYDLMPEKSHSH